MTTGRMNALGIEANLDPTFERNFTMNGGSISNLQLGSADIF